MADIFEIDFDLQTPDLIPPDKRPEPNQSIIKAILKPFQWLRDVTFGGFKKGIVPAAWAPGTYNFRDQVTYNKQVFEVIVTSTATTPDTATDWMLIQENFIGIDERIRYNGQKLVLEYALNKQFNGTFRQPVAGTSDIFIGNLPATEFGFRIGQTEPFSSSIGQSLTDDGIGGDYPYVQINNFQINIPTALYALTTEKAVRNFVGKYIPISLNYTIVAY